MTSIVEECFGINLRVLRTLCLYIPEKSTVLYKVRACVLCTLLTLHVPILGLAYIFIGKNTDLKRTADNAFVVAGMWCYVPKLWSFIVKASEIDECLYYFEHPTFVNLKENQKCIIDAHVKICKRNSKTFVICITSAAFIWALKPFIFRENILPVDIWVPTVFSDSEKYYYGFYLATALGVVYPIIANGAMDPLIAGLICLATGHFNVLKDSLQHLYEYSKEKLTETEKNDCARHSVLLYEEIQACIKHHVAILHFVEKYEKCFSFIVFNQFLMSIVVLCFLCWQFSILEVFSIEFLQALFYFSMYLVQIYFYCYYGTILYEVSNSLTDAAYMSNWYEYDMKSKKALIILMERCKKPSIVTAGKVLDLSLETFTTILRRSYSLLAVLKNQE